jgi:hypothetical protein
LAQAKGGGVDNAIAVADASTRGLQLLAMHAFAIGTGPLGVKKKSQVSSRSRSPTSSAFSADEALTSRFLFARVGNIRRLRERGRSMSTHTPTGSNWAEAMQPLEAQRQARVVASFAEYLAEDVHGNPDRALEAIAALSEWCDGDRLLLARARADVLRDSRAARAAVAEKNQDAVQLLELVARAS